MRGFWSYACDRHNAQLRRWGPCASVARAVAWCRSTGTCATTFCAPSGRDDASPLPTALVCRRTGVLCCAGPRRTGARLRLFRGRAGAKVGGKVAVQGEAQQIAGNIAKVPDLYGETHMSFRSDRPGAKGSQPTPAVPFDARPKLSHGVSRARGSITPMGAALTQACVQG
jgi:hypothetical protein